MEIDSSDDITLWNGPKERSHFEDMADLYSIIKTTQHLEKAYVRDLISADEYTAECQRLMYVSLYYYRHHHCHLLCLAFFFVIFC